MIRGKIWLGFSIIAFLIFLSIKDMSVSCDIKEYIIFLKNATLFKVHDMRNDSWIRPVLCKPSGCRFTFVDCKSKTELNECCDRFAA